MKYRFNGRIKAITFKESRVSVLLEDTTFLSNDGDWKQWTDWELIKTGKYKKGDVWVSAFEESAPEVYQACHEIQKGSEVELEIFKTDKGFLNINNIQLKVPERDVNEDLEPPFPEEETPSSTQRDPDSPEAQAERMLKEEAEEERASNSLDKIVASKETLIIRQTCIKAASNVGNTEHQVVEIAKRLEKYVLEGK